MRFGTPEIVNTDQGSQFTSSEFIGTLQQNRTAGARDQHQRYPMLERGIDPAIARRQQVQERLVWPLIGTKPLPNVRPVDVPCIIEPLTPTRNRPGHVR